jgi:hypothetical protein
MPPDVFCLIPRLINAALALFTATVLAFRCRRWLGMDRTTRAYWLGLFALLIVAAEGSIEAAAQRTPPGFRVAFLTVALVWTATAAIRSLRDSPRYRKGNR